MSTSATPAQDTGPALTGEVELLRPADPALDAVPALAPAQQPVFVTRSRAGRAADAVPTADALPFVRWRVELDWVSWVVTSLVSVAFFVLVVSGRVVTEGPVLLVLTATHGIHEGDLYALAAACTAIGVPVLRGVRRR